MGLYSKYKCVIVKKHEPGIKIEGQESHVQCMTFDRNEFHKANYFDLLKVFLVIYVNDYQLKDSMKSNPASLVDMKQKYDFLTFEYCLYNFHQHRHTI